MQSPSGGSGRPEPSVWISCSFSASAICDRCSLSMSAISTAGGRTGRSANARLCAAVHCPTLCRGNIIATPVLGGLPSHLRSGCMITRMGILRPTAADLCRHDCDAVPQLKLVMAHMGHPWYEECIVEARKQPNVYCEVSALFYRPWQFYNILITAQSTRSTTAIRSSGVRISRIRESKSRSKASATSTDLSKARRCHGFPRQRSNRSSTPTSFCIGGTVASPSEVAA
jgi:hypothetical protein